MPKKFTFQSLIYAFLILAFGYAIYTYRGQIADIYDVLRNGLWYYIAASFLVLFAAVYVQTALYASIYQIFEVPSEKRRILPLYLVTRFVTVAAPSGGLSAFVPFLQYARRGEVGVGRIIIANIVRTIMWYSSFSVFLLLGFVYLFLLHDLAWFEVSAGIVILVADIALILALVLSWVAPHLLEKILCWAATMIGRLLGLFSRESAFTVEHATEFVGDLNSAVMQMRVEGWRSLLAPVGYAFLNEGLNVLNLFLIALAFDLPLNFGILVTTYSISILFFIVSPTPGGLGFVEGAMILVMTTLDVPQDQATVVTLAYRGISFWLPFLLGFIALRWARSHPEPNEDGEGPDVLSDTANSLSQ